MKPISWTSLIGPALLAAAGFALSAASSHADGFAALVLRACGGITMWLALAWLIARGCDLLLYRVWRPSGAGAAYPRLLSDLLHAGFFIAAALAIPFAVFGYPAAGLVAVSSVTIAVLGFGLRNVIGDLFSGIALGIDQPYRTGDWIETTGGSAGRVTEIGWRTTRLLDRNGFIIVLPNGLIAGHRINNYGDGQRDYRTSIRIPLDPLLPAARAKRILLSGAMDAGRDIPGLAPDVLAVDFADGAAIYLVRFRVPDFGQENACRDAVACRIGNALLCAGQTIKSPLPHDRPVEPPPSRQEALLAQIDLFKGFNPDQLVDLAAVMQPHEIAAGEILFRQGDTGDFLCLLGEGLLEVTILRDGADPIQNRIAPGEVFGEIAMLTHEPRTATITAVLDSVVYEIHRQPLEQVMQDRPELAEALAAIMAKRLSFNEAYQRETIPEPAVREDLLGRLRALFGLPVTSK